MKRALAIACLCACRSPAPQTEETPAPQTEETPAPPPRETTEAARAVADAAPAVPGPDQPVVSFGGASRFGADSFVILPNGSARFSFTAPGKPEDVKSGMVAPRELAALRDRLKAAGCCALTSQRTTGVPDEGHTNLLLGFPGLVCSVSLWDNEWHDLPAAAACASLLEPVRRRLK
ncbi:MAG TPA: hypothetical protein VIG06_10050 [Kofleriaceae bacterium]|jgi:hypothetical protein